MTDGLPAKSYSKPRAAGTPNGFVFLPRQAADDLKVIVDAADYRKGTPTTREGEEARHSMKAGETRPFASAARWSNRLSGAVYQGSAQVQATLEGRVRETQRALVRLFPDSRGSAADGYQAWKAPTNRWVNTLVPRGALRLQSRGLDHGAGKIGGEVRSCVRARTVGHQSARALLHRAARVGHPQRGVLTLWLDQNKFSKAEFRVEKITL